MPSKLQKQYDLIEALGRRLTQNGLTMATAESCTGGGIGAEITAVAGSSGWFSGGIISYSNSAKINLLKVPSAVLQTHGAVSEAVVEAMALGGCKALNANLCVAVSGIAGPDGGSAEKPVGSVWVAWAQADGAVASELFQFVGNRQAVREQTIAAALEGVNGAHLPCL
ncbi:MAG TPA: damage-inducible protein CinA [Oceanospirillaceae bacterium]|nr:damage-inducible protein CinA [Oceanospirillaceae bacterium]